MVEANEQVYISTARTHTRRVTRNARAGRIHMCPDKRGAEVSAARDSLACYPCAPVTSPDAKKLRCYCCGRLQAKHRGHAIEIQCRDSKCKQLSSFEATTGNPIRSATALGRPARRRGSKKNEPRERPVERQEGQTTTAQGG